ncbi:MAG: tetratricopeptide repeat-containing protein [Pseudomonadota bacterium]
MTASASLQSIIAYARAGALDHAWALFEAGGYDRERDDPAALAIRGRLLKDRAQRASGDARSCLYAAAAEDYALAADLGGATYPLINAATLSLLAGDAVRAGALAGQVLARIAEKPDEPETPYYRAATRAEALLLLGRSDEARAALDEAIALAPRAWEDHASTIRQFALILAAQQADAAWLDARRPPRSLHFGGHMSFRADGARTPLTGAIAAVLAGERIGFGYGALAAGADILVAEALLECGAELHLVLPGGLEAFAALSVDPFGAEWRRRFDAVAVRAETVRAVEPLGARPDTVAIGLADEIAMGAARINAQRLASNAVQLLVVAEGEAEGRSQSIWAAGGADTQRVLHAPREPVEAAPAAAPATQRCLAALAVRADAGALAAIGPVLAQGPAAAIAPSFTGEAVVLGFERLADAADSATALAAALPGVTVGG